MSFHIPVLLNESIDYLVTKKDGIYFDGTAGFGGHSEKILKKINSFGTTVLLVTHNREIVNHLAKRVITLLNGAVVADEVKGKYRLS